MDILRQKKHAGAISMNDLKGCYDRVVHTVAILVLLAFGLNYTTAKLMMEVLQVAEHSIKQVSGYHNPRTVVVRRYQSKGWDKAMAAHLPCGV